MQTATLMLDHLTLVLNTNDRTPQPCANVELAAPLLVVVDFHYAPGFPACPTLPNGDPGYPAEPDELDIIAVRGLEHAVLREDDIVVSIKRGTDLLPLLSAAALEDLELDVQRAIGEAGQDARLEAAESRRAAAEDQGGDPWLFYIDPWDTP